MSLLKIALPDIPNRDGKLFDKAVKERLETRAPVEIPVYTYQELSSLTASLYTGYLVRCSNGDSGDECLAYCDGFNWKVIALGSNISLS